MNDGFTEGEAGSAAPGDGAAYPDSPAGGGPSGARPVRGQDQQRRTSPDVVEAAHFRQVLGHFATSIAVVTAIDGTWPIGFTCQSFASLSLDPPLVMFAPARTSTTWPLVARSPSYCVNVLAADQEALCRSFAAPGTDKFSGVGWWPGATSAPRLAGSLAWIECVHEAAYEGGDHVIAVGRVVGLAAGEGRPLLFYRGGFAGLS